MSVDVQPVASRRDLKEFIELPYRLHSTSGVWVPPLKLERRLFLSRRFNAFFSHGDAQLFLARRGGRVVGRISAHYDDNFNAHHGNRWGMFGFLELEDDPEILPALLEAGGDWLRAHGRDHLVGPMDFTMNDDCGVLVDGYNAAWAENWGFTPYGKKDLDAYAQELQLVFDRNWFMVAETPEGDTAAIAITIPDVNQALVRMNGRLLPLGWWHYLRRRRYIDRMRVGFLGVKPSYQHTGLGAA